MSEEEKKQINPHYAIHQLAKALFGGGENAAKKIRQWQDVISGIINGSLEIGSRTPMKNVPAWITPEVIFGGFATGRYAAGGELMPFEQDLRKRLRVENLEEEQVRLPLNVYYVSADGRQELLQALKSRCYRVKVPEESMLLVAAWLFDIGEVERATILIESLSPFFSHLRFYPAPATSPLRELKGDVIFVRDVSYCVSNLRKKKKQISVLQMNEAINVWTPLYDRAVSLFLETVDGDIPVLEIDEHGKLKRKKNGQPTATGGLPCKKFAPDWNARALVLLKDYQSASEQPHLMCTKHRDKKENFARLRHYLEIAYRAPGELTSRDIGYIRKILASYVTAHGAPNSELRIRTIQMQKSMALRPLHHILAQILADRLATQAPEQGVADLNKFLGAVTKDEAKKWGGIAGDDLPPSIIRKASMCKEAPMSQLVEDKILKSSEAMASQLSLLTSRLRASRSEDPELSQILQATYLAFRKRRSLLLLNLQSQVKFEELPWVQAVEPWIINKNDSKVATLQALKMVITLVFEYFPETILPNKLVKEIRALANDVDLNIPLVDELAADIFMGEFTINFLKAAKEAAKLLQGTLYERYYQIDFGYILKLDDAGSLNQTRISPGFANLCRKRLSLGQSKMHGAAGNGAIIEQAQILTTHNFASLWNALDLEDFKPNLPSTAKRIFTWVCKQQQIEITDWRARLHQKKNCAYAFRQMIFFLSLAGETEQMRFLEWMSEFFAKKPIKRDSEFQDILDDFVVALKGGKPECVFLGWNTDE
ncbi:MAG: hypothetical protein KIT34_10720 [Cyanobacteria bacterium TGS_CYA1]|nr:hypothetical protein [Cyanobacteria bacterium TGS_CYA1]